MTVVYKAPGAPAEIVNVDNTLDALQRVVGGYIETVTITTDAVVICNEEGRLRGMEHNLEFCGIDFVGPILIVGKDRSEFCDVPDPEFWMEDLNKKE